MGRSQAPKLAAGSRAGTFARLGAMGAGLLVAGLAVPYVAGDRTSPQVAAGGGPVASIAAGDEERDDATAAGDGDLSTAATAPLPSDDGATTAPAAGTSSAPAADATAAGTPAPATGPRTASDRGVTPDAIRLGMLILDVGPVGRAGTAVAIDPEQQHQAWQSFVDDLNSRGGINGRKVQPHYATFDVLSDDSARAACLRLTEDGQVFAVIGAFSKPASSLCVLEEHRTPMVSYIGYNPDSLYRRSGGMLFTTFPSATRTMTNFVHELDRLGAIGERKIGIVTDDQTDPGYETAPLLEGLLRKAGHDVVHRSNLAGSASSQVPVEVQQMRSKGVELVILLSATLNSQSFTQAASSQGWAPAWAASDWGTMNGDTTMKNAGNTFDGAIGITSTRNYEFRGGIAEAPAARQCREVYERRTGRRLAPRGEAENSLTMNFCDTFRIFEAAATRAGVELTKARFAAGVQAIGAMPFAAVGDGSFRAGKLDASDQVRTQRWRLDCRCWTYVDAFHPGRA
jgi:ABC-type branched-subunit amino acid transport system substrate-binding protein